MSSYTHHGRQHSVSCASNLPIIVELLAEADDSEQNEHHRMANTWMKAIDSIAKYPLPIRSVDDAAALVGIGDFIAHRIGHILNKIQTHNTQSNNTPEEDKKDADRDRDSPLAQEQKDPLLTETVASSSSSPRAYVPKSGTAPYYLLLSAAMYLSSTQGILDALPVSNLGMSSAVLLTFAAELFNNIISISALKAAIKTLAERDIVILIQSVRAPAAAPPTPHGAPEESKVEQQPTAEGKLAKMLQLTEKGRQASIYVMTHWEHNPPEPRQHTSSSSSSSSSISSSSSTSSSSSGPLIGTVLPFSEFTLHLLIDSRERPSHSHSSFSRSLNSSSLAAEARSLPSGDFLWIVRHTASQAEYVLDFIIERKRLNDLVSSIIDGRLREQRWRMKKTGFKRRIFLIEGHYPTGQNLSVPQSTIDTVLASLSVCHGYLVQQTVSLSFSLSFLRECHRLLTQELTQHGVTITENWSSFAARMKKRLVDEETEGIHLWATQLRMIKGISPAIAAVIVKQYPTCASLCQAYAQCQGVRQREERLLADLTFGLRQRKLGPAVSKRVQQFFCSENYDKITNAAEDKEEKEEEEAVADTEEKEEKHGDDDEEQKEEKQSVDQERQEHKKKKRKKKVVECDTPGLDEEKKIADPDSYTNSEKNPRQKRKKRKHKPDDSTGGSLPNDPSSSLSSSQAVSLSSFSSLSIANTIDAEIQASVLAQEEEDKQFLCETVEKLLSASSISAASSSLTQSSSASSALVASLRHASETSATLSTATTTSASLFISRSSSAPTNAIDMDILPLSTTRNKQSNHPPGRRKLTAKERAAARLINSSRTGSTFHPRNPQSSATASDRNEIEIVSSQEDDHEEKKDVADKEDDDSDNTSDDLHMPHHHSDREEPPKYRPKCADTEDVEIVDLT